VTSTINGVPASTPARSRRFVRRMGRSASGRYRYPGTYRRPARQAAKGRDPQVSELALEAITAAVPDTIGGSADLTGSNNTKTKALKPLTRDDYSGRYLYYGIREFGMAAAMNGMALHGGVIPFGGTFLIFPIIAVPPSGSRRCRRRGRLRHDARLDRARRGRPDPSADRASDEPAHDPQPARYSARRTRSRLRNAGPCRWSAAEVRRCSHSRARTCRSSGPSTQ
jgi:hypothetical protein